MPKELKFRKVLAEQILTGQKNVTWRLFDDKDLSVGDKLQLIEWVNRNKFADAEITSVREKKMSEINDTDLEGHEKFASIEEMYQTYSRYYKTNVDDDTLVKIIQFKLL